MSFANGKIHPLEAVIRDGWADQSSDDARVALNCADLSLLPTFYDVAKAFAQSSCRKASGEDGLGCRLFKSWAWSLAEL